MVRMMRVARATSSIVAVDCGGKPFENLDYTGDRFDQPMYPDLDLIREKGLVEAGKPPAGLRYGGDDPCRRKSLPSDEKVVDLSVGYWTDVTRAAWNQDDVQAKVLQAGTCLENKTGWDLAHPGVSKVEWFFPKVDTANVGYGKADWHDKVIMKYSRIFVDCAGGYAAAMQAALEAKRPEAVERNRELLTRLAQELAVAGYVP